MPPACGVHAYRGDDSPVPWAVQISEATIGPPPRALKINGAAARIPGVVVFSAERMIVGVVVVAKDTTEMEGVAGGAAGTAHMESITVCCVANVEGVSLRNNMSL